MGDPTGLVSGFAVEAVAFSIKEIICHINIARRCRKELESLGSLLSTLQDINSDLQKYRVAVNSGRSNPCANFTPLSLNKWLKELDMILHQANDMVQHCTIPTFNVISRYTMSKNITRIIARIEKHINYAPLIQLVRSFSQVQQTLGEMPPAGSSAHVMKGSMYIEEPLVVGQDKALDRVEELVMHNTPRIGVVGIGGSGKTLLLKRLCNRVEKFFLKDLLLWVTVSSTPSFSALRTELYKQISIRLSEKPQSESEEDVKIWVYEKLSENKFVLVLDDVWETSATQLLEELCVPPLHSADAKHNNIIILSSRSHRVLLQMGIPVSSPAIVDIQSLAENDSWKLFSFHAFPYNNGNLPPFIDEEVAKSICKECGSLPLAIKVIGRAMSAVGHVQEWESTLSRLRNAQPIGTAGYVEQNLYGRLRLSYDSLAKVDVSLQLCFLYLAAFAEDQVISTRVVKLYWIGEGLVTGDNASANAQSYVNILADLCLIEVVFKDIDGLVTRFRVHDILHDLATHIGLTEENCLFHAGRGLTEFPDIGTHVRISLYGNKLTSVVNSVRGHHICSLIMDGNIDLKVIPKKVIASMTSLQVLDLSKTSLQSLPKSIGGLKHLICLRLRGVPIKRLPSSVTSLNMLQILDLYGTSIKELPYHIHRMSSLRNLDIRFCKELHFIPHRISKLTSLKELQIQAISSSHASINDLSALKHLKRLRLFNNGDTIQHGTLGNMIDMEQLSLHLTTMESLPQDISAMSKLRRLTLVCPCLTKVELSFCRFQQLSTLSLRGCHRLKEVCNLHELVNLKQLNIVRCHEIEELPKEFGERGVFAKLEVLNLMWLDKLGELPEVDEEAMPSLKTLSIVGCESLKMLGEGYWNLKSVKRIRIYGCSMILQSLQGGGNVTERTRAVQTITMSSTDTQALWDKYNELWDAGVDTQWGEFWCNEFFQTLNTVYKW